METNETLEHNESLKIIEEMVQKARFNFSSGSFYFIWWGALLIVAALIQHFYAGDLNWIGWPVAGVVGGIGSAIYGAKMQKTGPMMHLDRVYSAIWITFFITLIFMLVALVPKGIDPNGYIMIIAGFPTLLTGIVLKFKPLQYGGVAFWVLGLVSIFVFPESSSLIYAFSMLAGYVIPGFIMKSMRANV
ncbi:MAG: hypothetical protein WEC59_00685 [Salibacteraceae bacterium]